MARKKKNEWDILVGNLLDAVKKINSKVEQLSKKTQETNQNISLVLNHKELVKS